MSQPDVTALARKWKFEVNTGSVGTPTWTQVNGLNEFTPSPMTATIQDDDVYENEGYLGKTKTALAHSAEAKLLRKKSPVSGVYDPGQEFLRTKAKTLGTTSKIQARYYDGDGGPEAYQGWFEVEWAPEGGATVDLESVTVTLHGDGELEDITNPAA